MTDDQKLREAVEAAANDEGQLTVDDAIEVVREHVGPSQIDDQIRQAEKDGDVATSIRLKRRRSEKTLAAARASADGGAAE